MISNHNLTTSNFSKTIPVEDNIPDTANQALLPYYNANIRELDGVIKLLNTLVENDDSYCEFYKSNGNLFMLPSEMTLCFFLISGLSFPFQAITKEMEEIKSQTQKSIEIEKSPVNAARLMVCFLTEMKTALEGNMLLQKSSIDNNLTFEIQLNVVETTHLLEKPKGKGDLPVMMGSNKLEFEAGESVYDEEVLIYTANARCDAMLSMMLIKKDNTLVEPKHKYLAVYVKATEIDAKKELSDTVENKKVLSFNELSEKYKKDICNIDQLMPQPKVLSFNHLPDVCDFVSQIIAKANAKHIED